MVFVFIAYGWLVECKLSKNRPLTLVSFSYGVKSFWYTLLCTSDYRACTYISVCPWRSHPYLFSSDFVTIPVTCFDTKCDYSAQKNIARALTHTHTHWTSSEAAVRPNCSAAGLNLGSQCSPSLVKAPSYPGTAYCNRKRFHPGRGCSVSGKGINAATSPVYWRARISWFLL